jgi:hypothetical protein
MSAARVVIMIGRKTFDARFVDRGAQVPTFIDSLQSEIEQP